MATRVEPPGLAAVVFGIVMARASGVDDALRCCGRCAYHLQEDSVVQLEVDNAFERCTWYLRR